MNLLHWSCLSASFISGNGMLPWRASCNLHQFQGVGVDAGRRYDFQCPSGLVPIGYGARSSCYSLKDFKVRAFLPAKAVTQLPPHHFPEVQLWVACTIFPFSCKKKYHLHWCWVNVNSWPQIGVKRVQTKAFLVNISVCKLHLSLR